MKQNALERGLGGLLRIFLQDESAQSSLIRPIRVRGLGRYKNSILR